MKIYEVNFHLFPVQEYFRYWLGQKIAALSTDKKRFSVVAVQYDPASDTAVIEVRQ